LRSLEFAPSAFADLVWWAENDKAQVSRVIRLIGDIVRDPFEGLGKPEPLKHDFSGAWSRRINKEHRLVYQVFDAKIRILACRYHY
jgi:toxin YoeB